MHKERHFPIKKKFKKTSKDFVRTVINEFNKNI